jgi:hypothetical protein
MKKPSRGWLFLIIPLLILVAWLAYRIPFINNRLSWRVEDIKTRIIYLINPPEEAIFIPVGGTPGNTPIFTPIPETPDFVPELSPTPSESSPDITATPLPEQVVLEDVVYVDQHERWNYCGPSNLAMALNYWGWPGDRDDVAKVVKPGIPDPDLNFIQRGRLDKNVSPSEMIDFVANHTDYHILVRHGGDLELLKKMIANGFPVLVEKGYYEEDYTGKLAWLGHYLFTTGYDESSNEFVVQDAYLEPGHNMRVDYQTYEEGWRSFNFLFMVIYPPDQEWTVLSLLGEWADPVWSYARALEIAEEESQVLTGVDRFFTWFNKGTSQVKLSRYLDAAESFDQAYQIYEGLEDDDAVRPYRITWYQTFPYQAYYYSGRYQDVINLANFTLDTIAEPTLEESLYWRGMAHYALGNKAQAQTDFYQSVWLNPNFEAGLIQISQLDFE